VPPQSNALVAFFSLSFSAHACVIIAKSFVAALERCLVGAAAKNYVGIIEIFNGNNSTLLGIRGRLFEAVRAPEQTVQ
jgi:hypothetical protein